MGSVRPRRLVRVLVALLVPLAAALALAWAARTRIAEHLLRAELASRGAIPATLTVTRVSPGGMSLTRVALGPADAPDLTLDTLELGWSLQGLRGGRLDRVDASGLRLRGVQDEAGLRFGAADGLWRGGGEGGNGAAVPVALPARWWRLRDAKLELSTPTGVATGELAVRLESSPEGAIVGGLALALLHPLAHANGTLAFWGTLADLTGNVVLSLRDAREPVRVAAAELRGQLSGAARALHFELGLEAAGGRLRAEANGDADLLARTGQAKLRVRPVAFAPQGLQPATLVPGFEALLEHWRIEEVSGRVDARGELRLEAGEPKLALDLGLSELGFQSRLASVSGVTGRVALLAPPLRTPAGQELSVEALDAAVPLRQGRLAFELRAGRSLAVEKTSWRFAGGELRADDLLLELGAERTDLRLRAHDLDLGALLALVSLRGVEGSGRIDGELPIVWTPDAVRIEGGALGATGAGVLRYLPAESVAELARTRPNDLGIAVEVLRDFRYDELSARIDGDLRGALAVALHVRGSNPSYQNGHPIELNLNLEAHVEDLVREASRAYRVKSEIEERLERSSGKEAP